MKLVQTWKRLVGHFVILAAATVASVLPAADVFSFAGLLFNQTNTPNQARLLGNNQVLGGAIFSPGLPTAVTSGQASFPGSPGFDTTLTLATLTGLGTGVRSVNLPNGPSGVATRHGIEVWWSGGFGLPNLGGPDFVVYESASSSTGVEGVLARVHLDPHNRWSDWFYFVPYNYQMSDPGAYIYAYTFDLSEMEIASAAVIDRIQIANLTQSDRIAGTGTAVGNNLVGQGKVLFDDSNNVLPDAGNFAASRIFDTGSLDPDPLYLAALQNTVPLPPRFRFIRPQAGRMDLNVFTSKGVFLVESSDRLGPGANWQAVTSFTNLPGGAMTVSDTGQNGRALPMEVLHRFYRITQTP